MSEIQNEPIFGEFNGQNMVGEDGKVYPVPPNYASKSKLQEGDKLKLVVDEDSSFIYKQVERQEVKRLKAIVSWNKKDCTVSAGDRQYKVLYQTATYFKLRDGDEAIVLIPKDRQAVWAAVENVIKKVQDDEVEMSL